MGIPSAFELGAFQNSTPSASSSGFTAPTSPSTGQKGKKDTSLLLPLLVVFIVALLISVGAVLAIKPFKSSPQENPAPSQNSSLTNNTAEKIPSLRVMGFSASCTASKTSVHCMGLGGDKKPFDTDVKGFENTLTHIGVGLGWFTATDEGGGVWTWQGDTAVKIGNVNGKVENLTAGASHACALVSKEGRRVWCWGSNKYGAATGIVSGDDAAPQLIGAVQGNVTSVLSSGYDTCATSDAGTWCWGSNAFGTLIPGGEKVLAPTKVES